MLAKRFRRLISWFAMGAFGFAQIAIAVHACPVQAQGAAIAAAAEHQRADNCADMGGARIPAQGNACESHCANAIAAPVQPDLPAATFVQLPAPAVVVAEVPASDGSPAEALLAISRAPPLTLRFCRLLI